MTQLVAWLLVCLALAWVLRKRPVWAVALVLVIFTVVPSAAGSFVTGLKSGPIAFHPATWLIFSILVVQLVTNPRALGLGLARHPYATLVIGVFSAGALLTSYVYGTGGTRLLADQIVGPFVLFLLAVVFAYGDRRSTELLRNTLLVLMAGEAVLTLVQSAVGSFVFWPTYYAQFDYLTSDRIDRFDRWFGTTDSALALSLGVAVAGALSLSLRSSVLRLGLLVVYLLSMLVTQSRTAAAIMVAVILLSIVRARMAVWARALTGVALAVVGYLVLTSTLVAGLLGRVANDTGSTDARVRALAFFTAHWTEFVATGRGLTSNYDIARQAGLETSLENSYLMYAVDLGFILTTLYFGLQLALLLAYGRQRGLRGATLAGLIAAVLQYSSSAVAYSNFNGVLIWTALAIVVLARSLTPPLSSGGPGGSSVRSSPVGPPQLEGAATRAGAPARARASTASVS